jgi:hypothetical protein
MNLKAAVDRLSQLGRAMSMENLVNLSLRRMSENATHLTEHASQRLSALLVLAGISLLRPRALPDTVMHAHSGVFNYGF